MDRVRTLWHPSARLARASWICFSLLLLTAPVGADTLYGLSEGKIVIIDTNAVASANSFGVVGLAPGDTLRAIDVRPKNGQIYGIASGNSSHRLYRIDVTNPSLPQAILIGPVSAPLGATFVGMDFDPVMDMIRLVAEGNQNLLVQPDIGAVITQTPLNPPASTVTALAFTNSLHQAGASTLFGIDVANDTLVRIGGVDDPASQGGGVVTPIGVLGVNAAGDAGFDIVEGGAAWAVFPVGSPAAASVLYAVNLATGALTSRGVVGSSSSLGPVTALTAPVAGRIRFSAAAYSVGEAGGQAAIVVERVGGSTGALTGTLTTVNGSATAPADYTAASASVVFADGDTLPKTINVAIVQDSQIEAGGESFAVVLSAGSGILLGLPVQAQVTIVDDDGPPPMGQPPTITITSPTTDPVLSWQGASITLSGTAADPVPGQVQSVSWTSSQGYSGTASGTETWYVSDIPLRIGLNVITVTATDNVGNTATDAISIIVEKYSYYLAEGATGGFFDMDLAITNPTDQPADVTIDFLVENQSNRSRRLPVAANTRVTVKADDSFEGTASTIVTSNNGVPLAVERTMRWDSTGQYGSHTDRAVPGTSLKWFFAEGAQGFFSTYLLLVNPHAQPNRANVRWLVEGGAPITTVHELLPNSRTTIDGSNPAIGVMNKTFGIEVTFDRPGAAERAMYFGSNPLWYGGHDSAGVNAPSNVWFLAEGVTGPFFETFLLLANPNNLPVTPKVTFLRQGEDPIVVDDDRVRIEANSRKTINLQAIPNLTGLENAVVATRVESPLPIIAERAQYWPDPASSWYEAHNAFGVTTTATKWGLGEGRVGNPEGFPAANYQTFILLANPNVAAATVTITLYPENGSNALMKSFTVARNERLTVPVGGIDLPLQNDNFGALVVSDQPIAVERAMYSNTAGQVWGAGTNAAAVRLP
jgi:hypothetical protein